eukprot:1149661-Pelagomonas_calceolata.AAC.1
MSNAPYYAPKGLYKGCLNFVNLTLVGNLYRLSWLPQKQSAPVRSGLRIGDAQLVDGMIKDGLWDPYLNVHMGQCGELCASRYGISREQQAPTNSSSHGTKYHTLFAVVCVG